MSLDTRELAQLIFDTMDDKQGENIVLLDIRPVSVITDYFVIGTAANPRQIKAIVEAVEEAARLKMGVKPVSVDGLVESGWLLMDYGDVVVHVFDRERREFYGLEEVWAEAPLIARMA